MQISSPRFRSQQFLCGEMFYPNLKPIRAGSNMTAERAVMLVKKMTYLAGEFGSSEQFMY